MSHHWPRTTSIKAIGGLQIGLSMDESFHLTIGDAKIEIAYINKKGNQIRLNIKAPQAVKIDRIRDYGKKDE